MSASVSELPEIGIGTRLSDHATFDLTVEGMGAGGMGLVVWGPNAAAGGGRMLAAKLLRPDRLVGLSEPERQALFAEFEREALTWCQLWPHPYLIAAQGLTRLPGWDGLPVLMIEYAPHGSLRDWMNQARTQGGTISLAFALTWAQQIAAALVALHTPDPDHGLEPTHAREALVHLDLKPENVLINGQGWALLTDFGLTRVLAASAASRDATRAAPATSAATTATASDVTADVTADVTGATAARAHAQRIAALRAALVAGGALPATSPAVSGGGRDAGLYATRSVRIDLGALPTASAAIGSRGGVAGTPPYMPPEQWLGVDATSPASDLYALGVLLFELFAGLPQCFPHQPERVDSATLGVAAAAARSPMQRWYEAHRQGPTRRLTDPDVRALTHGPLRELLDSPGGQEQARGGLVRLQGLIDACLSPHPAMRPSAAELQRALGELAETLGQERVVVPVVYDHSDEHEAAFWENLALTYGKVGQHERQLALQERALALTPNDPQRVANLGTAYAGLGREEEALATYRRAEGLLTPTHYAQRHPLTYGLPYNQGFVLHELGRYEEAVAAYQRSLARNPDQADALFNLAFAYRKWAAEPEATPQQRVERLRQGQEAIVEKLVLEPWNANAQRLQAAITAGLARAEQALREADR